MLRGNESIASYKASNIRIWMLMAFQGGIINMGGFLACHRFVSHVTGYGSLVPLELTTKGFISAFLMALVPISFLVGSMISGQLVDIRLKLHKKPKYYISFGLMFFLLLSIVILGSAGFFGNFGEPLTLFRDYELLTLLALVCGIQNATITSVSKSVIRTTHLSGITTDLGIGIMRYLSRNKIGDEVMNEGRSNLMRIGIISFFMFGSLIGCKAYMTYGFNAFLIPTSISFLLFAVLLIFDLKRQNEPE